MQTGYTYAVKRSDGRTIQASIYADPEFEPADSLELTMNGRPVVFLRLSDRPLSCGRGPGDKPGSKGCTSFECHRAELGKCACGRHPEGVPVTRATS